MDIHTTVPSGSDGRVLRLADSAAPGWTATLDGKPLTRTTVDGWAQGFRLPSTGGRLDVTYDAPLTHTAWLWAQGALAVVLVVLALPGRRRDVDDDLPEEEPLPAEIPTGEGRRARRLRAQAEEESAAEMPAGEAPVGETPMGEMPVGEAPEAAPAPAEPQIPHQQPYDPAYDESYATPYANNPYPGYGNDAYQQGGYDQQAYQADPYGTAPYDPYAYGGTTEQQQQPYDPAAYQQQVYDPAYDPAQQGYDPAQPPHGTGSERPDGSQQ